MKKAIVLFSSTVGYLLSSGYAYAQQPVDLGINNVSTAADPKNVSIGHVVGFVVSAAVVFGIIAALIYIVLGAFTWITSAGDKGKVESARNHIVAAIVGLVVIFLTLVVMDFVLRILGLGSISNLHINSLQNSTQ